MSIKILEKAITCLFEDKKIGEIEILYHAGEPMTVGKAFYKDALHIINNHKPPELIVTNVLQTNGVLINEDWVHFFAENNFKIGVSIDGPAFLHDLNRKNWSNAGSFNNTIRGYKLLKKHGIGTGVLTVITSKHLDYPDELINFYIDNEITDVGFNIEEVENDNKISTLGDVKNVEKDRYYRFMDRVLDLVLKYSDVIRIREISNTTYMLFRKQQDPNYNLEPLEAIDLGIVTIQKNGDITTYCPELAGIKSKEYNDFVIGNVLQINKLSDVKNNFYYQKIKKDYDQRKKLCKDQCGYYSVCGSSFISNVYSESKSLLTTENIGCILQKQKLTDVILSKFKDLSRI